MDDAVAQKYYDIILEVFRANGRPRRLAERQEPRAAAAAEPASARPGATSDRHRPNQHCVFCKKNGEWPFVYNGHVLKDEMGRTKCPILQAYTCPQCKACGLNDHTKKYCPLTARR